MERVAKIQDLLLERNLEAVLIKNKENKHYFGSLGGSGIYLLVTPVAGIQFFDGRYRQEIKEQTNNFLNVEVPQGSYLPAILAYLKQQGLKDIAIEGAGLSLQEYLQLAEAVNVTVWAEELLTIRSIKSPDEIEKITAACQLTDEVFSELLPKIHVGMTENELGAWIHYLALKKGASKMAFEPIVASGNRGALPHGRPTKRKFQQGELITIDFGVVLEQYQSDMTRTVALGQPTNQLLEIYELVKKAQAAAVAAIAPGKTGSHIDAVARKIIDEAGYGTAFSHGLGHGIGLGGDLPILNPASEKVLAEGMVMSCEPGIYLPEIGGVRIEDDVVLSNGRGIPLNQTTKELLIVGG